MDAKRLNVKDSFANESNYSEFDNLDDSEAKYRPKRNTSLRKSDINKSINKITEDDDIKEDFDHLDDNNYDDTFIEDLQEKNMKSEKENSIKDEIQEEIVNSPKQNSDGGPIETDRVLKQQLEINTKLKDSFRPQSSLFIKESIRGMQETQPKNLDHQNSIQTDSDRYLKEALAINNKLKKSFQPKSDKSIEQTINTTEKPPSPKITIKETSKKQNSQKEIVMENDSDADFKEMLRLNGQLKYSFESKSFRLIDNPIKNEDNTVKKLEENISERSISDKLQKDQLDLNSKLKDMMKVNSKKSIEDADNTIHYGQNSNLKAFDSKISENYKNEPKLNGNMMKDMDLTQKIDDNGQKYESNKSIRNNVSSKVAIETDSSAKNDNTKSIQNVSKKKTEVSSFLDKNMAISDHTNFISNRESIVKTEFGQDDKESTNTFTKKESMEFSDTKFQRRVSGDVKTLEFQKGINSRLNIKPINPEHLKIKQMGDESIAKKRDSISDQKSFAQYEVQDKLIEKSSEWIIDEKDESVANYTFEKFANTNRKSSLNKSSTRDGQKTLENKGFNKILHESLSDSKLKNSLAGSKVNLAKNVESLYSETQVDASCDLNKEILLEKEHKDFLSAVYGQIQQVSSTTITKKVQPIKSKFARLSYEKRSSNFGESSYFENWPQMAKALVELINTYKFISIKGDVALNLSDKVEKSQKFEGWTIFAKAILSLQNQIHRYKSQIVECLEVPESLKESKSSLKMPESIKEDTEHTLEMPENIKNSQKDVKFSESVKESNNTFKTAKSSRSNSENPKETDKALLKQENLKNQKNALEIPENIKKSQKDIKLLECVKESNNTSRIAPNAKNRSDKPVNLEYWREIAQCLYKIIKIATPSTIENSIYNKIRNESFDQADIPKLWPQVAQSLIIMANNSINQPKSKQNNSISKNPDNKQDRKSYTKNSPIKNVTDVKEVSQQDYWPQMAKAQYGQIPKVDSIQKDHIGESGDPIKLSELEWRALSISQMILINNVKNQNYVDSEKYINQEIFPKIEKSQVKTTQYGIFNHKRNVLTEPVSTKQSDVSEISSKQESKEFSFKVSEKKIRNLKNNNTNNPKQKFNLNLQENLSNHNKDTYTINQIPDSKSKRKQESFKYPQKKVEFAKVYVKKNQRCRSYNSFIKSENDNQTLPSEDIVKIMEGLQDKKIRKHVKHHIPEGDYGFKKTCKNISGILVKNIFKSYFYMIDSMQKNYDAMRNKLMFVIECFAQAQKFSNAYRKYNEFLKINFREFIFRNQGQMSFVNDQLDKMFRKPEHERQILLNVVKRVEMCENMMYDNMTTQRGRNRSSDSQKYNNGYFEERRSHRNISSSRRAVSRRRYQNNSNSFNEYDNRYHKTRDRMGGHSNFIHDYSESEDSRNMRDFNFENNQSKLDWLNDYLYDKRGVNNLQVKAKNTQHKPREKNTRQMKIFDQKVNSYVAKEKKDYLHLQSSYPTNDLYTSKNNSYSGYKDNRAVYYKSRSQVYENDHSNDTVPYPTKTSSNEKENYDTQTYYSESHLRSPYNQRPIIPTDITNRNKKSQNKRNSLNNAGKMVVNNNYVQNEENFAKNKKNQELGREIAHRLRPGNRINRSNEMSTIKEVDVDRSKSGKLTDRDQEEADYILSNLPENHIKVDHIQYDNNSIEQLNPETSTSKDLNPSYYMNNNSRPSDNQNLKMTESSANEDYQINYGNIDKNYLQTQEESLDNKVTNNQSYSNNLVDKTDTNIYRYSSSNSKLKDVSPNRLLVENYETKSMKENKYTSQNNINDDSSNNIFATGPDNSITNSPKNNMFNNMMHLKVSERQQSSHKLIPELSGLDNFEDKIHNQLFGNIYIRKGKKDGLKNLMLSHNRTDPNDNFSIDINKNNMNSSINIKDQNVQINYHKKNLYKESNNAISGITETSLDFQNNSPSRKNVNAINMSLQKNSQNDKKIEHTPEKVEYKKKSEKRRIFSAQHKNQKGKSHGRNQQINNESSNYLIGKEDAMSIDINNNDIVQQSSSKLSQLEKKKLLRMPTKEYSRIAEEISKNASASKLANSRNQMSSANMKSLQQQTEYSPDIVPRENSNSIYQSHDADQVLPPRPGINSVENKGGSYQNQRGFSNYRVSSAFVGSKKEDMWNEHSRDDFGSKIGDKLALHPQNEVTEDEICFSPRRSNKINSKRSSSEDSRTKNHTKIAAVYHNPADDRVINPNLFNKLNNRSNIHN